jgi:dolichol-phosphate mannosyltransferase
MTINDISVSVIIPCFNEEEVITTTHKRIINVLNELHLKSYELLYINDGSSDSTLSILKELAGNDESVKIISFSRNFGHQPAVSAGIHNSSGDIAIIIDADLQDPPELFGEMINTYINTKCNVVYGVRRERNGESLFKKITADLFYKLIKKLSDTNLPLNTGDFRLIDRSVISAFNNLKERNKYIRGVITWLGFKQIPMYYNREPRFAGSTKYPLSKMIKFATTSLMYFTIKPLHLSISVGFFTIVIGLVLAAYTIFGKYSHLIDTVPGWASTIIVLIFFGGVQLFTTGIIAEYVGSLFEEVKARPEYVIENKFNF